jgi:hypothetical protein
MIIQLFVVIILPAKGKSLMYDLVNWERKFKMPLIRKPDTQTLEDHFFGSGAFTFGWFKYKSLGEIGHFPVWVMEIDDEGNETSEQHVISENAFIEGIKQFAQQLPDRTFDDLIEDMDAGDVDAVIQLIMFGEIRYS